MPQFVPRKSIDGKKLCEGCRMWHAKTGMIKVAQLENPIHERTGKDPHDWYHGSKHEFHEFGDPAENSPLAYEDDLDDTGHWNTLLGNHFTSDHQVAADFANGGHSSAANSSGSQSGRVIHTKLHLKNPKVYASEHDMDQEVHEFEHKQGNTIDSHFPPPSEDEAKDWDDFDWEDHHAEMGRAKHYANDTDKPFGRHDSDPAQAYGSVHPKAVGWLNHHPDKYNIAVRFKERLKDAGHDGIVYGNEYETSRHGKQATSAIAFHPHQIEITQDHTVNKNCLKPGDLSRRPGPGQEMLPGTEDLPTKRPYSPPPGDWSHPVTWHDPKMWRESKMTPHGVDWGRLTAPLPQECWDRYHGRHTAKLAGYKMKYTRMTSNGYEDAEKEIEGPLYHGGRAKLQPGDMITPGRKPNSWGDEGPKSTHVYFSTDRDTAASYSQQLGNKGHLYEVEPTGDFKPDYGPQDYKTPHPLRVVRKVPREEWQLGSTATVYPGHETALHEMGKQTVYPVSTPRGVTNLCQHHLNVHQSISAGSNDLAGHLGIPQAPSEPLGASKTGTCAACHKNTDYMLKLQRPEGFDRQQQRDSKQPRTRQTGPYVPAKTKPLTPLRQSENAGSGQSDNEIRRSRNGFSSFLRNETTNSVVSGGSNRRAPGPALDHLRGSTFVQVEPRFGTAGHHCKVCGTTHRYEEDVESHYGVKLANEQGELFHVEPTGPQHSPKAEWHQRMIDKHTAPKVDPDDVPEDCDDCGEEHSANQGHRECRDCGERHKDYMEREDHETGYTDWDQHYPRVSDEIHRGMPVKLSASDRITVHGLGNKGSSLSHEEQAHALLSHIKGRDLGMHWTDHRPAADDFTTRTAEKNDSEVIIHAHKPEWHHIETDWRKLKRGEVFPYDEHEEAEVPLKQGAPVRIKGISWRPKAYGEGHGTYPVNDWIRHDFDEPVHHTASKEDLMKKLPTLQMVAHDATENQELRHCLTGDTRYLTQEGVKTLAETVGTVQRVLTGSQGDVHEGRWVEAMIHEFGAQPVLRVTLRRNKQIKVIRATAEHRWYVRRPDRIVETRDLKPEQRLAHLRAPVFGGEPDPEGIRMGAVFGDGHIKRDGVRAYGSIILFGAKKALTKYFDDIATREPSRVVTDNGVEGLRYQSGMAGYNKELPPLSLSLGYLRGWLMGYFATDGNVASRTGQMTLSSASLDALQHVQDVAALLGVGTYEPTSKMRQGYGPEPTLIHEMGFSAADLDESFFLREDQRLAWKVPQHERYGWTVVSVEDLGEIETVYCPRVPETESFVLAGGVHTKQCPFCGAGKIIGRQDGSVECEFCHQFFTVQVQPQFPNFPQTIDGQPQQIPGMPGQVETPPGASVPGGGLPPGQDPSQDPAEGGNPFGDAEPDADDAGGPPDGDADDQGGDEPPPFAKKSFKTVTGALLDEENYARHLAIRLSPDRDAMIALIRQEQGAS